MRNQKDINIKKNNRREKLLPDQELWQKIMIGDREAFASLFNTYYQQLYQFAGRFVKDAQAAENIVQDLFVTLWIKRTKLNIKSTLKSYLYAAIKNRSLSYRKKNLNHISEEYVAEDKRDGDASPEDKYIQEEINAAVHQAIANLPEKCRLIYQMKRYDNLRYTEIADILNISVNTVKTQLQRALKSLDKQITPLIK
jgi:RNA polymerase sigma-70 factor (ECF subfamily)